MARKASADEASARDIAALIKSTAAPLRKNRPHDPQQLQLTDAHLRWGSLPWIKDWLSWKDIAKHLKFVADGQALSRIACRYNLLAARTRRGKAWGLERERIYELLDRLTERERVKSADPRTPEQYLIGRAKAAINRIVGLAGFTSLVKAVASENVAMRRMLGTRFRPFSPEIGLPRGDKWITDDEMWEAYDFYLDRLHADARDCLKLGAGAVLARDVRKKAWVV